MEISLWKETQFYADVISKIEKVERKYPDKSLKTCHCVYSSIAPNMRIAVSNRGLISSIMFAPDDQETATDLASVSYLSHDAFVIVVDARFGKLVAEAVHRAGYSESVLIT